MGRTCSTKNETFCVVPTFCILLQHHSFYTDAAIIMFCPCSKGCLPHKRAVSTRSPRVASPDGMSPKPTLVYESANWCALEQRREVCGMPYARARLAARQRVQPASEECRPFLQPRNSSGAEVIASSCHFADQLHQLSGDAQCV